MSDSDDTDHIYDLSHVPRQTKGNVSFQVSGWEDDDEGVDEEQHPHSSPQKEILWAAEKGRMDIVMKLVQQDSTLIEVTDNDGYTPLHRACYNDHFEIVKSGARHSATTVDNWQPLHSACRWNNVKCASMLLSFGADVNAVSKGGVTAFHLAAGHKDGKQMIELFLSHPELILNVKDMSGDTPLNCAARSGNNDQLFEICEPCFL